MTLDIPEGNHYQSRVLDARRRNVLQRLSALTGAPLAVLGWGSALGAAASLVRGPAMLPDSLPPTAALGAWWGLVALGLVVHLPARLALRRLDTTDAPVDEGLGLRRAAGAVTLLAGIALLAFVGDVLFGGRAAPEVYAALDAGLSVMPGVGLACFVGAASGLYVYEELPRASRILGVTPGGAALRAAKVIAFVLGAILFAASMNVVSHFSVGHALVGAPATSVP